MLIICNFKIIFSASTNDEKDNETVQKSEVGKCVQVIIIRFTGSLEKTDHLEIILIALFTCLLGAEPLQASRGHKISHEDDFF